MSTLKMLRTSALLAVVLLAAGCLDTDLDLVNPNSPTVEGFWQDEQDATFGVDGVYNTLNLNGTWGRVGYWTWGRSDNKMSRSPAGQILNAHRGVWPNLGTGMLNQLWQDPYRGIFRANQVIHRVPDIDMNEGLKQQFVAEARFLRALYHFEQALRFGDVPINLEEGDVLDQPPFIPRDDVYANVISEALAAADDLEWTWSGSDIGRVTRGGALALAAEAHMMRHEWAQAASLLQQIRDSGAYELVPNFQDLFTMDGENTVESLFEVQFGTQGDAAQGAPSNRWPRLVAPSSGAGPSIGFNDTQPTDWGIAKFYEERGDWETRTGPVDPRLEWTYYHYDRPADDPDYAGMEVFGMPFRDRYIDTGPEGRPGFRDAEIWETYFIRKYQEYWLPTLTNFNSPVNFKIYRYGKILLMLAESLVETGDLEGAADALREVRARVGLMDDPPDVDLGSQQEMRDWVNREYLMELSIEGNTRWNYMERQGLHNPDYLNGVDGLGIPRNEWRASAFQVGRMELMPIPRNELERNPNAVQNPGW